MSYLFNASNEELIRTASVPVTTYPFTIALWFKPATLAAERTVCDVGQNGSGSHNFRLSVNAQNDIRARTRDTVSSLADTSTQFASTTTWFHAMVVFNSTSDVRAYLDGGGKGTDTTAQNPNASDAIVFGRAHNTVQSFDGRIGQAAIWNVALTDANATTLAGGAVPTDIPGVQAYWPMTVDATDSVGTYDLTVTNATFDADDPPVNIGIPFLQSDWINPHLLVTQTPHHLGKSIALIETPVPAPPNLMPASFSQSMVRF